MSGNIHLRSTEISVERAGVLSANIPLELKVLNVLSQVRRTMGKEDLNELAESILAQGQHASGVVVALTPAEAESYIEELTEWSGVPHNIHLLKKTYLDGDPFYLIVVAGHRRLEACKIAFELLQSGQHTSQQFTGGYFCEIHFGLTVDQALTIQFHENRHQQVAIHEEVAAAWRTWRFLRKRNPRLNVVAFAKTIGRTATWVRNMLRFCDLPESVQRLLEPNGHTSRVSYQLLVQHARLLEAERAHGNSFSELEVQGQVMRLVVGRVNPKQYAAIVSARIRNLEEGQEDFLFSVESSSPPLRKVALPHLIRGAHTIVGYWQLLDRLLEQGAFGDTSPFLSPETEVDRGEFSPHSPINLLIKITRQMEDLLPHLAVLAKREKRGRKKLERAMQGLGVTKAVLEVLASMER